MSLNDKLTEYALRYREWSKDKLWAKIPLWILILWMLGFFNPYWWWRPLSFLHRRH